MSENKYPIGGYVPVNAENELMYRIIENWGNAVAMPQMEGWIKEYGDKRAEEAKPAGAVWVKGDYDRLYNQLKADVNCRIVCYVDYNTRSKNPDGSPYILRDICSIWGENMEFGSRGIGYGSVRFIPGDYKENFIELCKQMNVEWLDESGTASNKDVEKEGGNA